MILNIEGNINRYYVETLCLVFFPGATFGEGEVPGVGVPEVNVRIYTDIDCSLTAYVTMKLNDKVCEVQETVSPDELIHIATPEHLAVGRALFACGKEMLGHIPPWGILTGIRPAKIAGNLLCSVGGVNKVKKILRDEYFLSHQKSALAVNVAMAEDKIIKKLDPMSCSLYVSIPFCPSRCSYCSFVSYTTPRLLSMIDEYIDAVVSDLKDTVELINELGMHITTVYIGGGTPTTLSLKQLTVLLDSIRNIVDLSSVVEYTLEAGRPDTITKEKLEVAKNYGVTRISVNPQTLSDEVLHDIGRKHTAQDFFRAFELAKQSGIRDINVDLIAGLPSDDFKTFSETIDKVIELRPTNITVHTFCVKKAADVLRKNKGVYSISGGDAAKSVAYSQLKTKFASYKPYYMYRQKNTVGNLENVGFSLEGHEGLYNVYMMEEVQTIFSVGAGSVTKLVDRSDSKPRIKRLFRQKYPYEYLTTYNTANSDERNFRREVLDFFLKNYIDN